MEAPSWSRGEEATMSASDRLEALRLAIGDAKLLRLIRAGGRALAVPLTAAERRLLGVG